MPKSSLRSSTVMKMQSLKEREASKDSSMSNKEPQKTEQSAASLPVHHGLPEQKPESAIIKEPEPVIVKEPEPAYEKPVVRITTISPERDDVKPYKLHNSVDMAKIENLTKSIMNRDLKTTYTQKK